MPALSRRCRGLLALLLTLLLLAMQQEALRHAISHFHEGHEQQELSSPQPDVRCVECFVLAEGSAALPARVAALHAVEAQQPETWPAYVAPTLARSTSHLSRAPPHLS